jgi:hypothetical protein
MTVWIQNCFCELICKAALDVTLPYVHTRTQFGKPIATFQVSLVTPPDVLTPSCCRGKLRTCTLGSVPTVLTSTPLPRSAMPGRSTRRYVPRVCSLRLPLLLHRCTIARLLQDCAGVILYSAESATQVALDAIQCLGALLALPLHSRFVVFCNLHVLTAQVETGTSTTIQRVASSATQSSTKSEPAQARSDGCLSAGRSTRCSWARSEHKSLPYVLLLLVQK